MNQKLFETIENITGYSCLESELNEIKNSIEFEWFDPNVTLPPENTIVLFKNNYGKILTGLRYKDYIDRFVGNDTNFLYIAKKWCFLPE